MTFLPENYEVPQKAGKYFKPKQGENRIRILASPILGNVGWVNGPDGKRKAIRKPMEDSFEGINLLDEGKIQHFWALPIWNYDEGRIQVWEMTQSTVQTSLKEYSQDPDWGDPLEYDITIKKTGEQLDTKYSVIAKPKSPLSTEAEEAWADIRRKFNLDALFNGDDPFGERPASASDDDDPVNVEEV